MPPLALPGVLIPIKPALKCVHVGGFVPQIHLHLHVTMDPLVYDGSSPWSNAHPQETSKSSTAGAYAP